MLLPNWWQKSKGLPILLLVTKLSWKKLHFQFFCYKTQFEKFNAIHSILRPSFICHVNSPKILRQSWWKSEGLLILSLLYGFIVTTSTFNFLLRNGKIKKFVVSPFTSRLSRALTAQKMLRKSSLKSEGLSDLFFWEKYQLFPIFFGAKHIKNFVITPLIPQFSAILQTQRACLVIEVNTSRTQLYHKFG